MVKVGLALALVFCLVRIFGGSLVSKGSALMILL